MKTIKFLYVIIASFLLTSCFEVNEEIIVNANGSGRLSMNTDMGKLLDMLQSFMPPEELEKSEFGKAKDTIIQMKDIVDTAQSVTKENKALLRDGSLHLQMNMAEKLLKVNIEFPFNKLENLEKIYANMEGPGGISGLLKGLDNKKSEIGSAKPDFKSVSSYFDLMAKKGSLTRKINRAKYDSMLQDSSMQQIKQLGGMGGGMDEIKLNTSIKLPRAAKRITGAKAELSTDKKTILIKNNMMDLYEHPENFEFSVEY